MARRSTTSSNGSGSESDSPTSGHNSTGPSDALILTYARDIRAETVKIEDLTDERKSLIGGIRAKYKSAKAAGIHIDALRRAIKDADRGAEELKLETQNYLRMVNLFNMPMTQADLFPADAAPPLDPSSEEGRKQAVFDAGLQGLRAGKAGFLISDNPYHQTEDNAEHVAWVEQWHAGQAFAVAKGLTPKVAGRRAANGSNPEDRPEAQ